MAFRNSLTFLALAFLQVISYVVSFHVAPSSLRTNLNAPTMIAGLFGGSKGGASKSSLPADKKLCVITGTTSGLGFATVNALLKTGKYYVICANRDVPKMEKVAKKAGFDPSSFCIMEADMGSFDSVKKFVANLKKLKGSRPLDRLVCNAAVYQPAFIVPKYTVDNIEEQLQINHLSHFLLCNLLLEDMKKAKDPRMIIVGSITGNDNTVGGGTVYPIADLGELEGLKNGAKNPISMIDGGEFIGAKAYKDAKMCNMMTIRELHKRYHKSTGIVFSTMYPGCIATTQLFREKRQWFRTLFPIFMKYVTGGFVGEEEAGQRLAETIDSEEAKTSGVYYGWNGGAKTVAYLDPRKGLTGAGGSGGSIMALEFSAKIRDDAKSKKMWDYSTQITNAVWPKPDVSV